MADISLNLNKTSANFGDLLIVNGDLIINQGTSAILQNILQRLRVFYGEWFLDVNQGLPYFGTILVKNPDQKKIDALFINTIVSTPGVVQLNSYNSNYDFKIRTLTISFTALTTQGVVDYSGVIDG